MTDQGEMFTWRDAFYAALELSEGGSVYLCCDGYLIHAQKHDLDGIDTKILVYVNGVLPIKEWSKHTVTGAKNIGSLPEVLRKFGTPFVKTTHSDAAYRFLKSPPSHDRYTAEPIFNDELGFIFNILRTCKSITLLSQIDYEAQLETRKGEI